jgi:cell division protein FtsN
MDWIRRNWPDLLIGMGLLAVIAGIVATLLTGGAFFPLGTSERQQQPAPASRTADAGPPVPGQGTAQAGAVPAGGTPVTIPNLPSITQTADPDSTATADSGMANSPVDAAPAVVALRPGDPAGQPAPVASPAAQAAAQPAPFSQIPLQPVAQDPGPTATPPAAPPSGAATQAEDPEAPYRVSVGSFRNADNARRQAELFRQAGYPVFLAAQDDLTLVLLGPYRLETEAERVRSAVASGGFDVAPIIYTFRPDDAPALPAAPPAQQVPAVAPQQPAIQPAAASAAPAASAPVRAPTASAAGRYLQAGAYSSQENAQLQRSAIEALGFRVIVQQDGNLLRVLVGPYGDSDLLAAQGSLARQGIDSIPR